MIKIKAKKSENSDKCENSKHKSKIEMEKFTRNQKVISILNYKNSKPIM